MGATGVVGVIEVEGEVGGLLNWELGAVLLIENLFKLIGVLLKIIINKNCIFEFFELGFL